MSLPLRIKVEKHVLRFIETRAIADSALAELTPVAGHSAEEPELPYLVVYCGNCVPFPDMPMEAGIWLATVVCHIKTSAAKQKPTDDLRANADPRLEMLWQTLMEPVNPAAGFSDENKPGGAFLAYANKPGGTDARPAALRQFHCYDLIATQDTSASQDDYWHEQLTFQLVCQPFDSH